MKHTVKDLKKSIARMQATYDNKETPDNVKQLIKPSLDKARDLLTDIEKKPEGPVSADAVVKKLKSKGKTGPPKKLSVSQNQTLQEIVAASKKFAGYRGKSESSLQRDSKRRAKPPGRRISAAGNAYTENRIDHSDISAKAPYLEKGGTTDQGKWMQELKTYKNQNGEAVFGFISIWNKGIGKHKGHDVVYFLDQNTMMDKYYSINVGIDPGNGKLVDITEASPWSDIMYETPAAGFEVAYNIATDEDYDSEEDAGHEFKRGGQVNYMVTKTKHLSPDAVAAFTKGIEELEKEEDKTSLYYSNAQRAMGSMLEFTDELMTIKDPIKAHELLQKIAIQNYRSGMLVDTSFLNTELATRKLEYGGSLDESKKRKGGTVPKGGTKPKFLHRGGSAKYDIGGKVKKERGSSIAALQTKGKLKRGGAVAGKRNIGRDRKFKSQEPHEQAYKRKTSPKNPVYDVKKIIKRLKKHKKR